MLDSIHLGATGLQAYQRGLRVIANNTSNLNTPGYKSATLQFADVFYANAPGAGDRQVQLGHGVQATGTQLDFRQGELRQTGNGFDLALEGEGLFMLRDAQGRTRYTRAGQFQFDAEGVLVNRGDGSKVLGSAPDGRLREITLDGLRTAAGKATGLVRLAGNLSSTSAEQTVGSVKVFDAAGGEHALALRFTRAAQAADSWQVEVLDGSSVVATSQLAFVDGRPTAETARFALTYTPTGQPPQALVLEFGRDVSSFASGSLSTLAMAHQDGWGPGTLAKVEFDAEGRLVATYSNGQASKGDRLALGRFHSSDAVEGLGGNLFAARDPSAWELGAAGDAGFGTVRAGALEMSNVDLSREFSDLVVMQRGYQAASQVVSTANDMLQELFGMKRR